MYETYLSFASKRLMRADMRKVIRDKSDSFAIPNEFQRSDHFLNFIKLHIIYRSFSDINNSRVKWMLYLSVPHEAIIFSLADSHAVHIS